MTSHDDTLPRLLVARAQGNGAKRPAIREKEFGIWQTYTWTDYADQVRRFAAGLLALGFRRGDKLALIGDNRPQLYWAEVAVMALGGVPVPLYQDAIAAELQYVIDHSGSRFVVAEDQEQVDKMLEMRDKLPGVEHIIFDDAKGMRHYDDPHLVAFASVQARGDERLAAAPDLIAAEIARGGADDVAIINYTSGTTGFPKGVMLTHRGLIDTARNFIAVEPVHAGDELMAYLPMAWIGDAFFSLAVALVSGATINCPEDTATVRQDFREIGPTLTFAPPRIWETLLSQAQVKIEDGDWLKRGLTRFFLPRGMRAAKLAMEGAPVPATLRLVSAIGRLLVLAPLRDQLGLRRIRSAITGGAALGPEMMQFFRALGVNLKQLYGMTETCAPVTLHRDDHVKLESVGPGIPGVELKITELGEVWIKAPGNFAGYYKNPEATAETLRDGWIITGDAGLLDPDGHLVIIDRVRDVSRLRDGSVFAPQYVENKLKFSPYIKEAVALGHDRPFVTAMINIDADVVGNWAERRSVSYTGYTDLAQNPAVYALVLDEVRRTNQTLAPTQRIRRFALLHKELDADDAEITRTRKLRRRFIHERYRDIIDALDNVAAREATVRATVTYEDGRTSEVTRVVRLEDVPDA